MAMSGVTICDDLKKTINDFKLQKLEGVEYLKVTLNKEKTKLVLADTGRKTEGANDSDQEYEYRKERFATVMRGLEEDKPCFIVYDFHFLKDGAPRDKLALIFWCSDTGAPAVQKMVYATLHKQLTDVLENNNVKYDFHARDDFTYDSIIEDMTNKLR